MDRDTMSAYGFIVITTILIALLLGMAMPVGERISISVEKTIDVLLTNTGVADGLDSEKYGTVVIHHRFDGSTQDEYVYKASARINEKVFFDTYFKDGYTPMYKGSTTIPPYITVNSGVTNVYINYLKGTYSVTYNLNGGNFKSGTQKVVEYTYGNTYTLPKAEHVEKDGYKFVGWFEDAGLSGLPILSIDPTDSGNKTYYAKYAIL